MNNSSPVDVVVVGAGIAGLCAAYELTGGKDAISGQAIRVTIIEASNVVGGKIQSFTFDGDIIDAGPDGVLARRPEVPEICNELGIADHLVPIATKGASVYARGAIRTLPDGLVMGIPTNFPALRASKVLSRAGLIRVMRDRFAPVPSSRGHLQDRSIGNLVETKLGSEVVTMLVDPMLGGINAGRVSEMSAAAVYAPLLKAAQERGSLMAALRPTKPADSSDSTEEDQPAFTTLDNGFFRLVEALEGILRQRDVTFLMNTPVTDLVHHDGLAPSWSVNSLNTTTRADGVVLALPAQQAGDVVAGLDDELAALFRTIDYASVAIVTLRFNEMDVPLPESGTGLLVPPETQHPSGNAKGERFLTTALTFLDRKWPHLKKPGSTIMRVHMGRIDDTRTLDLSDEELIARAIEELDLLFDATLQPTCVGVKRWEASLPQYRVNHLMRSAGIEQAVQRYQSLAVAGAAYHGVGVPACIGSGRSAGRSVRESVS